MINKHNKYEQIFILFSNRMEYWFIKIIISLLVLLLIFQWLLQFPVIRHAISIVDKLEGIPYSFVDYQKHIENYEH